MIITEINNDNIKNPDNSRNGVNRQDQLSLVLDSLELRNIYVHKNLSTWLTYQRQKGLQIV